MDEEEKSQTEQTESQPTDNAEQKQELLNVSTIIANLEQKMSAKFSEFEAKLNEVTNSFISSDNIEDKTKSNILDFE